MNNPYLTVEGCVDRLYQEYKKHPKLIIACDHDDTVFDFHKKGLDYSIAINVIKACKELGFYIVVFTGTHIDGWDEIIRYWTKEIGIVPDSINKNPIDMPFGNHGKIYFNILLDDRAGLGHSIEVLEKLVEKIKIKEFYNESEKE